MAYSIRYSCSCIYFVDDQKDCFSEVPIECAQRRLRSAWASVQSDQSSLSTTLGPKDIQSDYWKAIVVSLITAGGVIKLEEV